MTLKTIEIPGTESEWRNADPSPAAQPDPDERITRVLSVPWGQDGATRWDKGCYYHNGRMCLVGALYQQGFWYADISSFSNQVHHAVQELFPDRYNGTLEGFNDHADTTLEDVLLVLKHAGEAWREAKESD